MKLTRKPGVISFPKSEGPSAGCQHFVLANRKFLIERVVLTTFLSFACPKERNKEKGTTKKAFLPASCRVPALSRKAHAFRGRQPHLLLMIVRFLPTPHSKHHSTSVKT